MIVEPISSTQFSKGSFLTIESSPMVRASPTDIGGLDQGLSGNAGDIIKDKHFLTIVKMIETILALHEK